VSHDGVFIVRDGGATSFYYDRWAALQISRLLLTGPDAAVAYVRGLHQTEELVAFTFTCGAVLIDCDRGELLYWANQFAGRSSVSHRYYRLMLAEVWSGWTTRWAMRGARDFADELGLALEGLDREPHASWRAPRSLAELRVDHAADWERFIGRMAPGELASLIADCGEDLVRFWAISGGPGWVTLRHRDGRLTDHVVDAQFNHLLIDGHHLVELLHDAHAWAHPSDAISEELIEQTAFIDEAARRVDWWWAIPPWLFPWRADELWPGWTLVQHDGGPRRHIELTGRSVDAIRCSAEDAFTEVSDTFSRILTAEFDPARWLANAARAHAAPDTTITINLAPTRTEPVGVVPGGLSPEAAAALRALIAANP
jgi:hypothetical protein